MRKVIKYFLRIIQKIIPGLILFIVFIYLIFITYRLIYFEKTPQSFDLNFDKKHEIISSYGTLLGAFLSLLSIISILYTIRIQKNQFDEIKKREDDKKKSDHLEKVKIVHSLFIEIINNITYTSELLKKFIEDTETDKYGNNTIPPLSRGIFRVFNNLNINEYSSSFINVIQKDSFSILIGIIRKIEFYNDSLKELDNKMKELRDKKNNCLEETQIIMNDFLNSLHSTYLDINKLNINHNTFNLIEKFQENYYKEIASQSSPLNFMPSLIKNLITDFNNNYNPSETEINLIIDKKIIRPLLNLSYKFSNYDSEITITNNAVKNVYGKYYDFSSNYYKELIKLEEDLRKFTKIRPSNDPT